MAFTTTIYFDMDGTFVDLYGVNGWMNYLNNYDATPYRIAKPLGNMQRFARGLHRLQKRGYRIGIISWLSKTSNAQFDIEVTKAKERWLRKHLPSVQWDEIHIVPYGNAKQMYTNPALGHNVLVDDEMANLVSWNAVNRQTYIGLDGKQAMNIPFLL